jgi:hypothetical protein
MLQRDRPLSRVDNIYILFFRSPEQVIRSYADYKEGEYPPNPVCEFFGVWDSCR